MSDQHTSQPSNGHRGVGEVERSIERTRGAIDRTLDEIGDRLHPQQLMHQVVDIFRSDDEHPSEWAIEARRGGKRLVRKIKRNPIPALLIGAGAAWLWMQDEHDERRERVHRQWDDLPEHGGSFVDARTGKPYDEDDGKAYRQKAKVAPAWHADHDWSDSHDDEASWTTRAESAMKELRTAIGDTTRPLKERLGLVTGKVASLSGLKRSEIQRALHAQWDDLPEHSGSFVDARTGEPYDNSYGKHWQQLAALDLFHPSQQFDEGGDEDEDESWSERAEQTLSQIQASLSETSGSAKERLSTIGGHLGTLAQSSRSCATKYSRASGRTLRSAARGVARGGKQLGHQVGGGYEATRDYVADTVEENPLAVGVAVLGLGLLVGAMLPSTAAEDRLVGESADAVKERGAEAAREAMERGQEMASAVGEAAYEEAERQGLTPHQIAAQARHGAEQLADSVKQPAAAAHGMRERVESVAKRATEAARDEMHDQQAEVRSEMKKSPPTF